MKKNYINIKNLVRALIVAPALFLASCQNVIDLEPQTALSEVTAFQTPQRIELAVAGVYDAAQSGTFAGNVSRGYSLGAAHVQQGDMRGEDGISVAAFFGITYQNNYDATTANNVWFWNNLYRTINRANVVIEGIDEAIANGVVTAEQGNAYKGELLFLRALSHHFLVIHYARPYNDNPTRENGGIPYRTVAIKGGPEVQEALTVGRGTVAEVYERILADLDAAEAGLPVVNPKSRISRASKGAAIALKTRVRLHQNNWAAVREEAAKLLPAALPLTGMPVSPIGGYTLTASPMGPFGAGARNNPESIFSIEHNDVDNAGVNGSLSQMNVADSLGGRGIVAISPILWNQPWFLASDIRKSSLMVIQDRPGPGRRARFTRKYTDPVNMSDNAPHIRYAEVLLNAAEAEARGGDPLRALQLLNYVRNRSVTDVTQQYVTPPTDLVQTIVNERRIEFIQEGKRWGDIHRLSLDPLTPNENGIPAKIDRALSNFGPLYTGDPTTTFAMQARVPYDDFRFIWPIPADELVINPGLKGQQNPQY
jgi:starch-binding outer membrane protein, SusD/RagB family